jgi:hypothetical protein
MLFFNKLIIKNKIKNIETRIDVLDRLIKLNEYKINQNNDKLTTHHYQIMVYNEEKDQLKQKLDLYYKKINKK